MERGDIDAAMQAHGNAVSVLRPVIPNPLKLNSTKDINDGPPDEMLQKVDRLNDEIKQLLLKYSGGNVLPDPTMGNLSSSGRYTDNLLQPTQNKDANQESQDYKNDAVIGLEWKGYRLQNKGRQEFGLSSLENKLTQGASVEFVKEDSGEFAPLDDIFGDIETGNDLKSELKGFGENSVIPAQQECLDMTHQEWINQSGTQISKSQAWKDEGAFNLGKQSVIGKYFGVPIATPPLDKITSQSNHLLAEKDYYQDEDSMCLEKIKSMVLATQKDLGMQCAFSEPVQILETRVIKDKMMQQRQPIELLTGPTVFKLQNNVKEIGFNTREKIPVSTQVPNRLAVKVSQDAASGVSSYYSKVGTLRGGVVKQGQGRKEGEEDESFSLRRQMIHK